MLDARDVVRKPVLSGFRKTEKDSQSDARDIIVMMRRAPLHGLVHTTKLNLKRKSEKEWYFS